MATSTSSSSSFNFPRYHSFPPLYTSQPSASTEASRLSKWSSLILSYCQHSKIYKLVLADALNSPLFHNFAINRQLALNDVVGIIEYMRKDGRAEWVGEQKKGAESKEAAWIYWRTPEEWAMMIYTWIDDTAQKGSILTLYELHSSDATRSQEFYGIDQELLMKAMQVLVKRGKAQLFGQSEDEMGVKFL